jgi:hypothetical protein
MIRDRVLLVGLAAVAALPACTGASSKTTPGDEFASIVDPKTDSVSGLPGHPTLVGSLAYGQTADATYHSGRLAFKFAGAPGDQVDIWVRSTDGDAVAWLYNDDGKKIALNDDADSTTLDSHINAKLIANRNPAIVTYYIVFRDYYSSDATFTVELRGPGCFYNGQAYSIGDSFPANDGCNHCSCNVNGQAVCTKIACPAPVQGHTCGGNIINAYQCPAGYKCVYHPTSPAIAGAPGNCEQLCGGIAARACTTPGTSCQDDWTDSCDPAAGGADCGGVCENDCPAGQVYSTTSHGCVTFCVQTVACTTTSHWDSTQCKCVPNTCVRTVLCTTTSHWDPIQCKCVAN